MTVTLSNGITITFQSAAWVTLPTVRRVARFLLNSVPCAASTLCPAPLLIEVRP